MARPVVAKRFRQTTLDTQRSPSVRVSRFRPESVAGTACLLEYVLSYSLSSLWRPSSY